jgi:hypothetical protein
MNINIRVGATSHVESVKMYVYSKRKWTSGGHRTQTFLTISQVELYLSVVATHVRLAEGKRRSSNGDISEV